MSCSQKLAAKAILWGTSWPPMLFSCRKVDHHLVILRLLLLHEETPVDVTFHFEHISIFILILFEPFHWHCLTFEVKVWPELYYLVQSAQQDDSLKLSTSVHSESDSVDYFSALTVKIFFSLQMYEMSEFSSPFPDTEHIHHSYSRRRHNWSKFWISSGRKMGNLWKIIITL